MHFGQILSGAVKSEDAAAVGQAVRYLAWCWGQRAADEQFVYFVEYVLRHLLERSADKAAFCAVADSGTFATLLGVYANFHDKREVDELEREFRLRPKPNKSCMDSSGK